MRKEERQHLKRSPVAWSQRAGGLLGGLLLLISVFTAQAQVANDDIVQRRVLKAEETASSNTTDCTVQWDCIDPKLTGKCIEYHNDQWFEFTPATTGRYFVNIGGQQCRDVRGVQLVVISGEPCKPSSYQILSCTSLGTQDDIFVTLERLQAGKRYLLEVDGYLKDFCQFTLQVSTKAVGVPASYFAAGTAKAQPLRKPVVELHWSLPDSLASASEFRVLRRELRQFQGKRRRPIQVLRDTYGQPLPDYSLTDTLPAAGTYQYQVMAVGEEGRPPTVVRQHTVSYGRWNPGPDGRPNIPHLELPLDKYPVKSKLSIVITDPKSGKVLRTAQINYKSKEPRQNWVFTEAWEKKGLREVAVAITCHPPGKAKFFTDQLVLAIPSASNSR